MFKFKRRIIHFPWLGLLTAILILLLLPFALQSVLGLFLPSQKAWIADLFTPQVQYWGEDIVEWAANQEIDPNLMATIMQIESCGHPTVVSNAGAQGLFQVMPFHFDAEEDMLEPATNAKRSANFIEECTQYARGDPGLILACYNGGPTVTQIPFHLWPHETQRYYVWGLGIYYDARNNNPQSPTLNNWLQAGGKTLCNRATNVLGIR